SAFGQVTFKSEPLATLGDSLALCRSSGSASGAAGGEFDVGAYDIEQLVVIEVDARGRRRATDVFAADQLGDAVVRLYERHAELLPDGPERARAAATARSVAVVLNTRDTDAVGAILDPGVEFFDHRTLGLLGSSRGAKAFLRGLDTLLELTADRTFRTDDV